MDTLRVKMCAFARACLERMQAPRIAQADMLYILVVILLYHIAGMQALRIAQADFLQRSRELAQEVGVVVVY